MSTRARTLSLSVFFVTVAVFASPQPGEVPAPDRAEALLPLERQMREQFPSIGLHSQATFQKAQEIVAGRTFDGMRLRALSVTTSAHPGMEPRPLSLAGDAVSGLRAFYSASFDDPFVIELGEQRVVLRAVGAHFSQAVISSGKLVYAGSYDSVDVIELPSTERSEELLVLQDSRAPRVFEYEIVEMRGVAALSLQDGGIRFAPDRATVPTVSEMANGRFVAVLPSLQIDRPWVIDATGHRSESAARWTVLERQDQPRRIRLTLDSNLLAYPLVIDPSFSATGNMSSARQRHTSTLLPDGKVLIAGGISNGSIVLNSAELYDPANGTFTVTSTPMTSARYLHTATLLSSGKVLIAGGRNASDALNTAELYDPVNRTFTATVGPMISAREIHTATLLRNDKVLICGGDQGSVYVKTAELFDASSGTFKATNAPMAVARGYHTATLLPDGDVLIAGGENGSEYLNSAEVYQTEVGTFAATNSPMTSRREVHTSTLLPNGTVLVAGGSNGSTFTSTAELYDPASKLFASISAPLTSVRLYHTATLLPNGKVLIAAGNAGSAVVNTSELFEPASGMFTAIGASMNSARQFHTATLLPDGKVLMVGGNDGSVVASVLNTAEVYEPAIGTFTAIGAPITSDASFRTATLLPDGTVLLAGGWRLPSGYSVNAAELYDPSSGTFTATSAAMLSDRQSFTATLLPNGKVLIAGGTANGGLLGRTPVNTTELFDPESGTFTANASMTSPRANHTATLLPNGKVLIAGGEYLVELDGNGGFFPSDTAELYDSESGTFATTRAPMPLAHSGHTATLLPNGKVLIAGGGAGGAAELYDPGTGTFAAVTAPMVAVRLYDTATLLPNGKVLIAGGKDPRLISNQDLATAELFDPASETFTPTNTPMTHARYNHTATLLPNGTVLMAAGSSFTQSLNADIYDPETGTFTATSTPMSTLRHFHTATLMLDERVLIEGGQSTTNTAELYDAGLGISNSRRPLVSSMTNPLCQPSDLMLNGSLITGDSEGSSGSTNSSAANAPLLRLQRVDNDQFRFVPYQIVSASSFLSTTLSDLPSGTYRVAIVSNGIPSVNRFIEVETSPLLATYDTAFVNLSASTTVPPSSLPPGYHGALYPQNARTSGFTGTLFVNGTTGAVDVTNAGPPGTYLITVSSSTSCGSPTTTFTLNVIGPPSSVTATAGTPQTAPPNTPFGTALQARVTDIAGRPLSDITVNFTAPLSGASATFPNAGVVITNALGVATITPTANGTMGGYNVTAAVGDLTATFALTNTDGQPSGIVATATTPTSVSISWNGTAGNTYEVLRIAAGGVSSTVGSSIAGVSGSGSFADTTATADTAYLYDVRAILPVTSPYSGTPDLATTVPFTDPSLVAGTTLAAAAHIADLRTAVDAVRALAALGPGSYTNATLTPGSTVIRSVHIGELRLALKAARSALHLPVIDYTTPTIVTGTTLISSSVIDELRNGVR